jgi:hypothetical protein
LLVFVGVFEDVVVFEDVHIPFGVVGHYVCHDALFVEVGYGEVIYFGFAILVFVVFILLFPRVEGLFL